MKRFWDKVISEGDCLVWVGSKNQYGYGRIKVAGKCLMAHRFVFDLIDNPIPENLQSLHSCDNPPCVNPGHLFWGTRADNFFDMVSKGRQKGAVGERNFKSKLTAQQVSEIREKYSDRKTPTQKIAALYGVSQPMISYILIGKHWKGDF